MKVTIFGSGYVGLVSGVCFAHMGNSVKCVDIDADRVARLQQGECPIFEPGLTPLLQSNLKAGRIDFTTDARAAVRHAEIILIAVGTPPEEDGSADLQYVLKVAETIGEHLQKYKVVVNKSTVPVGTAQKVHAVIAKALQKRGEDIDFDVVSNPEFLKEGAAVNDCMRPDRIVIGTRSARAKKAMSRLYAPFNRNHDKLMVMDETSAELTKYAANAMLATKISFMNEISRIADQVGADVEEVRRGIGSDPRIGFSFIYPGCGYGGSCFPKDVQALRHTAEVHDYQASILDAVHAVNERQKQWLFDKIAQYYQSQLSGKTFAVWGLAFKPNTDDIRDAPSRVVIEQLIDAGARVQAFDPEADKTFAALYEGTHYADQCALQSSMNACLQGADALVIFTEWMPFRSPDFTLLQETLQDKVIFDGRNLYEPQDLRDLGLDYVAMGRNNIVEEKA